MKTLRFLCPMVLLAVVSLAGQAVPTITTLSAAVTTPSTTLSASNFVTLTSATGVVAPTTANPLGTSGASCLFIDKEAMRVSFGGISGTTIRVSRGYASTASTPHLSGATVWILPCQLFGPEKQGVAVGGSCSIGTELVLPWINTQTGDIWQCLGGTATTTGRWAKAIFSGGTPPNFILSPNPASAAYTGINTNGTAMSATVLNCTEMYIPASKLLTSLGVLNGTTVGTDKHIAYLYSALGGSPLANSALAGATSSGASAYQYFTLTSQYYAVAGDYFVCFQSNGATDTIRMTLTGIGDQILTKGQTGSTFGTAPTLVAPTTFTTAVGPYVAAN